MWVASRSGGHPHLAYTSRTMNNTHSVKGCGQPGRYQAESAELRLLLCCAVLCDGAMTEITREEKPLFCILGLHTLTDEKRSA